METLPNIKMYSLLDYKNVWKYNPHRWRDIDDVQILYSAGMRTNHGPHAICIYYEADSQKVLVYDSSMYKLLDPTQQFIIGKLYPFNKGIVFKEPKNLQGNTNSILMNTIKIILKNNSRSRSNVCSFCNDLRHYVTFED